MQALIDPNDPRQTGYRVAQVVADGAEFPVAAPLFWAACADNVKADEYWYDPANQQLKTVAQDTQLANGQNTPNS